jgi:alpha-ribazole phosphatase/probable phosphoglycerate mutase
MDKDRESSRFFLIRHGETDWNRNFRYQGSSDVPLNDNGLEQARRLGVRFSRVAPDRVFASPLSRARRTAEVIMEHNPADLAIESRDELREISFGIWEGLSIPEIKEIDGETFATWRAAPFSCAPEGGETFAEIFERSKLFSEELTKSSAPGENTFIVAHGGVLRAVMAAMMGFGDIDILWKMRFDNCSITIIDIWRGRPSLLLSNDTHHIRLDNDDQIVSLSFPD